MKKSLLTRIGRKLERMLLSEQTRKSRFLKKNQNKARFTCPVCEYNGPFMDMDVRTGLRKHAKCVECNSLERHRLLFLTMQEIGKQVDFSNLSMMHFAPEDFFRDQFRSQFGNYETADLFMEGVDHKVDICDLPFKDESHDLVCASHVLEHIGDDRKAISEVWRILKPGGIALLPVPMVADKTAEYPEANPEEHYHWRAPGPDYFDKYRERFSKVDEYRSEDFPPEHQVFVFEDRTIWPTPEMPLRPSMVGEKHTDWIPVCYK